MSWSYSCPHCRAVLSPHRTILLIGENAGRRILIGFHPEPGNYQIFIPPGESIEHGTRWRFFCPLCREDLGSGQPDGLCALNLASEQGHHRVLFSRTAGERATFVVGAGGIEAQHGEHVDRYLASLVQLKYVL